MQSRAKVQKLVCNTNEQWILSLLHRYFIFLALHSFHLNVEVSHCFCTKRYFIFAIRNGCSFCTLFSHFLIHTLLILKLDIFCSIPNNAELSYSELIIPLLYFSCLAFFSLEHWSFTLFLYCMIFYFCNKKWL